MEPRNSKNIRGKVTIARLVFVLIAIITGFFCIEWLVYLIGFKNHQGYTAGLLGYPVPFSYALFYFGFLALTFLGFLLMVFFNKIGWLISQIMILFSLIGLGIASWLILFTKANFSFIYVLGFLTNLLLILLMNSRIIMLEVKIKKSIGLYLQVVLGVLCLSMIAAKSFNVI